MTTKRTLTPVQEFERRLGDVPTLKQKAVDRTALAVTLIGTSAFLYQLIDVLHKHQQWIELQGPSGVGELLSAILYGLLAIGGALGLNTQRLIKGFTIGNKGD